MVGHWVLSPAIEVRVLNSERTGAGRVLPEQKRLHFCGLGRVSHRKFDSG